jgi:formylglycine-generating enzyme required for sulfatase activity
MGRNPSYFRGDDLPVEQLSWDDCQDFSARLGQVTGQRFRLPTEAEWEYACRAGTTTPFSFGATMSTDQANYNGNDISGKGKKGVYRRRTTRVGSFPANAWGLFDMHGNLWEWCQDMHGWYHQGSVKNPKGASTGIARVLRGGSWGNDPALCRSAFRYKEAPVQRHLSFGCRVVLCLDGLAQ